MDRTELKRMANKKTENYKYVHVHNNGLINVSAHRRCDGCRSWSYAARVISICWKPKDQANCESHKRISENQIVRQLREYVVPDCQSSCNGIRADQMRPE